MNLMIISDIHGSLDYLEKALVEYKAGDFDKLVILGDILYHGPRNPLPKGHGPAQVAVLLNEMKNDIIAVRGNCDAEVDQMVLEFPMRGDYYQMEINGQDLFFSHGHLFDNQVPEFLSEGTIYIQGHTHIPMDQMVNGVRHLNPGSIALPKADSKHSYIEYINGEISFKALNK